MAERTPVPHDPRAGFSRSGHRLFSPVPGWVNAIGALLLVMTAFVLVMAAAGTS
ncbi:hypothetical protein [Actinocorallia populi]|uniref:hypothetical protein n=1 Tax=Actinocorallia populi TaxID=2079200 RepID=UPI0013002008|nr:hypothetical protein [Actinocorallia populi]